MNKPYVVENGYTVPIQAPLVNESCLPPFECLDNNGICAYFTVNPDVIKKYLEPTPFEYYSNVCYAYVSDWNNATVTDGTNYGFFDSGIGIPVLYRGRKGIHILFEYEDQDYAIAAGRELWGYPKKYGEVSLEEKDGIIRGTVRKNGKDIIQLEVDTTQQLTTPISRPALFPHFQIKVMPKPDGPGIEYKKILSRDPSADFKTKSYTEHPVKVKFEGIPHNRLDEFTPIEVFGASLTVGDAYVTNETGWTKVEEVFE
ncbi:acetoacetate decarboxylase family protein [Brevibacillus nitrificans]|uniref:acetoacetate decarboxylase family protein n=1 Tax=Brevibacillus nitrificans TaxID=651560 RepID=UPI002637DFE6|nr:acetoacetate decarboxylase family protein [Brevibacillus nitrificans]MED1795424.1 acetoacetate decarboxylase family protein [Brevibacillus nitrificans]